MKRSTIPFGVGFTALSAALIVTGCAGPKSDRTSSRYNEKPTPTYSGEAERSRDETVGAPGANSSLQRGSAANPGDSSRQNKDESEPPRQQD
jgi:hypothetical protein